MATDGGEEYRFLIEDTQQISARRQTNNNVYLSATSIVLGAAAFLVAQGGLRNAMMLGVFAAIAVAGVVLSWEWARQNKIYGDLLAFRYDLLHSMEAMPGFPYPVALFHKEDVMYKPGGRVAHFGFSETERWLPLVFRGLYVLGLVGAAGILLFVGMTGQWAAWGVTWPH